MGRGKVVDNDEAFIKAVAALFKGVPMLSGRRRTPVDRAKLLRRGVVLAPGVEDALPDVGRFAGFIAEVWGRDLLKLNSALHKSFGTVRDAAAERLLVDQLLHYASVYLQTGGDDQASDRVDDDLVYVPLEELSLPGYGEGEPGPAGSDEPAGRDEPVRLTVIRPLTDAEVVARARGLLGGLALSQAVQEHLVEIVGHFPGEFTLAEVTNRELRVRLMDRWCMVPDTAGELLRFLIFKRTGMPMVVNSQRLKRLMAVNLLNHDCRPALTAFVDAHGVEAIAREFNRHRDLWVLLKHDGPEAARIVNRAKRLARWLSRPPVRGPLDRISDPGLTVDEFRAALGRATLWRRVVVANALRRRTVPAQAALYVVRVGRAYAVAGPQPVATDLQRTLLAEAEASIVEAVRPHVEGLRVHIPAGVDYAFPTSMKAFVGPVPFWTTVDVGPAAVVGIHWVNAVDDRGVERRTDLDLHYISAKIHVGWNTRFDDEARRTVLYSGDLTNAPAPAGASEAMYIGPAVAEDFAMLSVNKFTDFVRAEYTLFVGDPGDALVDRPYLLAAHEALLNVHGLVIDGAEDVVGFVESTPAGKRLHFTKVGLGRSIVASDNEYGSTAREAVRTMLATRLGLREVLLRAGAVLEPAEDGSWDVDLALENLTMDSFAFLTSGTAR